MSSLAELVVGQYFDSREAAEAYREEHENPENNHYHGIDIHSIDIEGGPVILGYAIAYADPHTAIPDLGLQIETAKRIIGLAFGDKLETKAHIFGYQIY